MATQWREAFCPICGLSHGKIHIRPDDPEKRYLSMGTESFWDRTELYTGDKPFGVIKESEGRGTMRLVDYYGIDGDYDGYFPQIKARFCAAIAEWIVKGWMTPEDLQGCIAGIEPGPRAIPAKKRPPPPPKKAEKKKEAKPKKEKKVKPPPPEPIEWEKLEIREVVVVEPVSEQNAPGWYKRFSILTNGEYMIDAWLGTEEFVERKEGEYYGQTYSDENTAIRRFENITTVRALDRYLIKE